MTSEEKPPRNNQVSAKKMIRYLQSIMIVPAIFLLGCAASSPPSPKHEDPSALLGKPYLNCAIPTGRTGEPISEVNGYTLVAQNIAKKNLVSYSISSPHSDCSAIVIYPESAEVEMVHVQLDDHGNSLASQNVILEYLTDIKQRCSTSESKKTRGCELGFLSALARNGVHVQFKPTENTGNQGTIISALTTGFFFRGNPVSEGRQF